MKKPLLIVGGINAAILILVFLLNLETSKNEAMTAAGMLGFLLFPLNILIGVILAIAGRSGSSTRNYGFAFLLSSGFVVLCGFGFCSQSHLSFQ